MQKEKTMKRRMCTFLLLVAIVLELFLGVFGIRASAAENSDITEETFYSNAYNDLRKDENFDPFYYPSLPSDDLKYYSLELITITESEDGELFVYLYQPSGQKGNLRATSINITKDRKEKDFKNYNLTYINSYDVFFKYKVADFTVSADSTRTYEISSVYRAWNEAYGDKDPGSGNTVSEKDFPVGRFFTFSTSKDGSVKTIMQNVDYITITNKYVGYIRYKSTPPGYAAIAGGTQGTDSHFVAFSADMEIERLLEADVFYTQQVYSYEYKGLSGTDEPWGEKKPDYVYIDYEQQGVWTSDGVFTSSEHTFDRIQETQNFLKMDFSSGLFGFPGFGVDEEGDVNWTDDAGAALQDTQWVLCFKETPYINYTTGSDLTYTRVHKYTRIGDVSILRLKFKTDGITYNLGVVDNKQSGSENPSGIVQEEDRFAVILMLLGLILFVVLFVAFSGPMMVVLKIIGTGLSFLLNILLFIVKAPFKIIGHLTRQKRR